MGNNKKKKGGAAKSKKGSSPAARLDAAWANLKPSDPSITEFPVWYSAPGTKRVESGDVDGLAVRYPKPYVDLVKDSMREVAAALFELQKTKNNSVGIFAQARAVFTGGSSLMPTIIWAQSMWPEETPVIWKEGELDMRTFIDNELIGRGKKGDGSLPHPLIPRGTAVVDAFELDHDVKVPNSTSDGAIDCYACKYLEQMSEATDEDPDAIPWRPASQTSTVVDGVPSVPVRLEIRAAFGGDAAATEECDCDYVLACVFGDADTSAAQQSKHSYKILKHLKRKPDRLEAPEVSVEPLPGKRGVTGKTRDKAAAAAALMAWMRGLQLGVIPSLPSFVSFVASAVREILDGADKARVGTGLDTVVFPGVATCQLGTLACEAVRRGPTGPTMMLRRKTAEMYESTVAIAHRGLDMKETDYNEARYQAIKSYKAMTEPRCLQALRRTGGFEAQTWCDYAMALRFVSDECSIEAYLKGIEAANDEDARGRPTDEEGDATPASSAISARRNARGGVLKRLESLFEKVAAKKMRQQYGRGITNMYADGSLGFPQIQKMINENKEYPGLYERVKRDMFTEASGLFRWPEDAKMSRPDYNVFVLESDEFERRLIIDFNNPEPDLEVIDEPIAFPMGPERITRTVIEKDESSAYSGTSASHQACAGCGAITSDVQVDISKMRMCGGCKAAYYCSKECQETHWPEHKKVCAKREKKEVPDEVPDADLSFLRL